jgi:hypothetical protein
LNLVHLKSRKYSYFSQNLHFFLSTFSELSALETCLLSDLSSPTS